MATWSIVSLGVEVVMALIRFVLTFYAFWLVLRSLEGLLSTDTAALRELSPLAHGFTDPFVQPLAAVTRLPPRAACWVWLVIFAIIEVALTHAHRLA